MARYDAIVVGVGGMGSAAAYHLARRGKRVLGLERFTIPNEMGSSHGVSRIIRLAYFEDPAYVPLLRRSFELWRQLEGDFGEQILHMTGCLHIGAPGTALYDGCLRSCAEHRLQHEVLDPAELRRRFPAFRMPPGTGAIYESEGGFLVPEKCILAHAAGAREAGAELREEEAVLGWEAGDDGVRVSTERGDYEADSIKKSVEFMERLGDDRAHYWYGHYYAAHALNQVGGEAWEKYYKRMRDKLLASGYQKPGGEWYDNRLEAAYGPCYQTAIAVLILSVPTHYLPIYQK